MSYPAALFSLRENANLKYERNTDGDAPEKVCLALWVLLCSSIAVVGGMTSIGLLLCIAYWLDRPGWTAGSNWLAELSLLTGCLSWMSWWLAGWPLLAICLSCWCIVAAIAWITESYLLRPLDTKRRAEDNRSIAKPKDKKTRTAVKKSADGPASVASLMDCPGWWDSSKLLAELSWMIGCLACVAWTLADCPVVAVCLYFCFLLTVSGWLALKPTDGKLEITKVSQSVEKQPPAMQQEREEERQMEPATNAPGDDEKQETTESQLLIEDQIDASKLTDGAPEASTKEESEMVTEKHVRRRDRLRRSLTKLVMAGGRGRMCFRPRS